MSIVLGKISYIVRDTNGRVGSGVLAHKVVRNEEEGPTLARHKDYRTHKSA